VKALAAERRNAGGVASGLALTLVAAVDEKRVREAETAAATAAAAHPCRLIMVVRGSSPPPDAGPSESRLDAEIVVGGRLGPCEAVVLRMHGRLAHHAESVVIPLLAPDVPVVTWWHGVPPVRIAFDPLGVVADRRISDAAQNPDPMVALRQRAEDYAPGDTDLAWTRTTPWRSLIASALDTSHSPVVSAIVRAQPTDPTAALLRGWLRARLGIEPEARPDGLLVQGVTLRLGSGGELTIQRDDGVATLRRTGLPERTLPLPRRPRRPARRGLRHLDGPAVRRSARRGHRPDRSPTPQRASPSLARPDRDPDGRRLSMGDCGTGQRRCGPIGPVPPPAWWSRLLDAQAERGLASIVLTGGRTADRIYRAIRESPPPATPWTGRGSMSGGAMKRFLPAGHPIATRLEAPPRASGWTAAGPKPGP
jgi:glucose-6-phosphate dehydrogenase assembly protein OpcA